MANTERDPISKLEEEKKENSEKPVGTYQCIACERICDGSELYLDPQSIVTRWTCSDLTCGANVRKISDKPKAEYVVGEHPEK